MKSIRTLLVPMVVLALVGALTGCATMEGKWSLAKVNPTAARDDFAYSSLTLQKDGTFYAEAKEPTGSRTVSGTWTMHNGLLSLKEESGERHVYDAKVMDGGKQLMLVRHWNGQRLTAVLDKRST